MSDSIEIKGHINLKLYSADGKLLQEVDKLNTIVTVGKQFLVTWLAATSQSNAFMPYIGLGSGSNAASTSDTGLQTELPTRVAGLVTSVSNRLQNQAVFGPGINTGVVAESGLFSAISSGTMFARQTFSPIFKEADQTIIFAWSIVLS